MTPSASRTASTLGLRALPTAMRVFSIQSAADCSMPCRGLQSNACARSSALWIQINIVAQNLHLRLRLLQLSKSKFLVQAMSITRGKAEAAQALQIGMA